MPKSSNHGQRHLHVIIDDLKAMKDELLPHEVDSVTGLTSDDIAKFDTFQRHEHDLNLLLHEIRCDVTRLTEMRTSLGSDNRDVVVIRLSMENVTKLRRAADIFGLLKQCEEKQEQKKKKNSITDRRSVIRLLGEEIRRLTGENSNVQARLSPDEIAMVDRINRRRESEAERNRKTRQERRGRKSRNGDGAMGNNVELDDVTPRSPQELIFEERVAANMKVQDEILQEIDQGLSDLWEIANSAHTQLVISNNTIHEVDRGMDQVIHKFKTANKRMKDMLAQSGGCARWCCVVIAVLVLLTIGGYALSQL